MSYLGVLKVYLIIKSLYFLLEIQKFSEKIVECENDKLFHENYFLLFFLLLAKN